MQPLLALLLCGSALGLPLDLSKLNAQSIGQSLREIKLSELLSEETLQTAVGLIRGAVEQAQERDQFAQESEESILDLFNVDTDLSNDEIAEETSRKVNSVVLPDALGNLASRVQKFASQVAAVQADKDTLGTNRALLFMSRAIETGKDPAKVLDYLRRIEAPKLLEGVRSDNVALERLGQSADGLVGLASSVQAVLGSAQGRSQLVDAVQNGLKDALDRGTDALSRDDAGDGDEESDGLVLPGGLRLNGDKGLANSFFGFLRAGFSALQGAVQKGRSRGASEEKFGSEDGERLNRLFF